jgi:ubiquinone/menaquinone biosynthesis C-methylase UbiE
VATARLMNQVTPLADADEIETDITEGALTCSECRVYYPIFHSVPRMLTYPTEVALHHARVSASWLHANLPDFSLPHNTPPPGEKEVLRNFSTQWTEFGFSGRSYWSTTPERAVDWMRYSLGTSRHPFEGKLVLEVGIGIGAMADGVSRSERCEIVGVDLGYGVDTAQQYFGANAHLHVVQASVFALPFREATFNVVYSHGVIHHTYSTHTAFAQLARLPKEDGMLYVWVYSHEDGNTTRLRRTLMWVESAIRPTLSRLPRNIQIVALTPVVPVYMAYQGLVRRRKMGADAAVKYGWTEALIAARDRLTPPFAHRHSYDEVAEWFRSESYDRLEFLRDESIPGGFADELVNLRVSVGIRGFKHTAASNVQEISTAPRLTRSAPHSA